VSSQVLYAITAINNPSSSISTLQQDILYTAFNKAKSITEGTYAATISYGFDQQRRKMVVTNSGSTVVTKYYVGDYEKIITGTVIRELHYLGDAIFVRYTNGGAPMDSMYYIHADHLGSIATVLDQNRNIKAKYSYDAWGRRRNYTDYTYTLSGSYNQNVFDRFYTGHESIPLIGGTGGGLINMNGRMYDPLIARMLSTDNYVQAAGFTQSYNRYSYCLNNPLKYTDPTGDIFGTIITAVWDFGTTIFTKGAIDPWNTKSNRQEAWKAFDPTSEGTKTNNAFKIDMGVFKTDPNRTTAGQAWQLFSRFTWELPQTMLGNTFSHARNITGNVTDVTYYGGATLVNRNNPGQDRWGQH
jgi:RHS repeat-associated protein